MAIHFFTNFATEFHEKDLESERNELLRFIFEIITKMPVEDLMTQKMTDLIRDFMLNKYFSQKKERREVIQKIMQLVYNRTGKFIQLDQNVEYIKGNHFIYN